MQYCKVTILQLKMNNWKEKKKQIAQWFSIMTVRQALNHLMGFRGFDPSPTPRDSELIGTQVILMYWDWETLSLD